MADIVDHAKDVLGVEDAPEDRKQDLKKKKAQGDDTDRDRKELDDLKQKRRGRIIAPDITLGLLDVQLQM